MDLTNHHFKKFVGLNSKVVTSSTDRNAITGLTSPTVLGKVTVIY